MEPTSRLVQAAKYLGYSERSSNITTSFRCVLEAYQEVYKLDADPRTLRGYFLDLVSNMELHEEANIYIIPKRAVICIGWDRSSAVVDLSKIGMNVIAYHIFEKSADIDAILQTTQTSVHKLFESKVVFMSWASLQGIEYLPKVECVYDRPLEDMSDEEAIMKLRKGDSLHSIHVYRMRATCPLRELGGSYYNYLNAMRLAKADRVLWLSALSNNAISIIEYIKPIPETYTDASSETEDYREEQEDVVASSGFQEDLY